MRSVGLLCLCIIWTLTNAAHAASKSEVARTQRHQMMAGVQSWGYQLQKLNLPTLAAAPFDLLVVDHAPDRAESVEAMFRPSDLAPLKVKPDGSRRVLLSYISIGEAERYRFYWDETWVTSAGCPSWLGPVNPQWVGNYPVEFWQPQWQSLMFGQSDSYVDRVLHAGFDGIYLDRADVYEQFKSHANAKAEMTLFLTKLIDHARTINPNAIVVLQNAEELVSNKGLRNRLDGIAKESLYFNADQASQPNPPSDKSASVSILKAAQKAGAKVMVVEYLDDVNKARQARREADKEGFLLHVTERSLSTLNVSGSDYPVAQVATPPGPTLQAAASDAQILRASPCS